MQAASTPAAPLDYLDDEQLVHHRSQLAQRCHMLGYKLIAVRLRVAMRLRVWQWGCRNLDFVKWHWCGSIAGINHAWPVSKPKNARVFTGGNIMALEVKCKSRATCCGYHTLLHSCLGPFRPLQDYRTLGTPEHHKSDDEQVLD